MMISGTVSGGNSYTKDILRPGGVYKIHVGASIPSGSTLIAGIDDGVSSGDDRFPDPNAPYIITIPAEASQAHPLLKATGQEVSIDTFTIKLLPSFYRVTSKQVNDGNGHSDEYTYTYAGAAMNDDDHSASICPDDPDDEDDCHDYVEKYSEFRGHSRVTEIGPDGRKTKTFFHQDDDLKGRVDYIQVLDANGNLVSATYYTYEFTKWDVTPRPFEECSVGCEYYSGLKRRWVRVKTDENRTYAADGVDFTATKSEFTYASAANYGNLKRHDEYEMFGTYGSADWGWNLYRYHETVYYPIASGDIYLVGLPAMQTTFDALGTVLARTQYLYDGHTDYTDLPTDGILSKVLQQITENDLTESEYEYDPWGNQTSVTVYSEPGDINSAQTTSTIYDSVYYTYPESQTNELGHETTMIYDSTLGVPTSVTDPNGNVTTAEYDAFGRLIQVVRPGDNTTYPTVTIEYSDGVLPGTTISYDCSLANFCVQIKQKIIESLEATEYYTLTRSYDGIGRQIKLETGSTVDGNYTRYNTTTTNYYYSSTGLVVTQSTPFGQGETPYYTITQNDSLGRPDTVTAPDGNVVDYDYDGLVTTVENAKENVTATTKDVWGRTVLVDPPTGPVVSYEYDELDRLTQATRDVEDTFFVYDDLGRKESMTDPDMGNWTYEYDALGNLTRQKDARGQRICMYYDALNRLVGKHYRSDDNCPTSPTYDVSYSYDQGTSNKGYRTGMSNASSSAIWDYDNRGRLVSEIKTISGQSYETEWDYNSADLPISITYPDNEVVTYEYNDRMLLEKMSGTDNYVTSTTYDSAGRMTFRDLDNGLSQVFQYYDWNVKIDHDNDNNQSTPDVGQGGRLESMTTGVWDSGTSTFTSKVQYLGYLYDPNGNIDWIKDFEAGVDPQNPQVQDFEYDTLDRLTSAEVTGGTGGLYDEDYTYDPNTGNLASKGGVNYTYDTNHPHAVASFDGNTYAYDANGNQIKRVVDGQTIALEYDAENRLVKVCEDTSGDTVCDTQETVIATFTYDGDGARVMSVIDSVTTRFVGNHYEVTGSTVTKYYYAGASRIAMRKDGTLNYILSDHLGSTSLVTNDSGTEISEMRYTAWGEVRYESGTPPTEYTYTGQYSEGYIKLLNYVSRRYDPELGRFIQPDSIVPLAAQGVQAFDRYAYGNNNPIRYNDPSGHRICDRPDSKGCLSNPGDYGFSFEGDYSGYERSFINRAVEDVAYAIWAESDYETPWEAFRSVYGNFTFGKCGQGNYRSYTCDAFGWTLGRSTIIFDGFYRSLERNVRLVVHELGHAFDHYVCQISGECNESDMGKGSARHDLEGRLHGCTPTVVDGSDCLGRQRYDNDIDPKKNPHWGFAGGVDEWQFAYSKKELALEVFADMFIGWVYDSWGPGKGGANRRYYMNTMMPAYLNR